MLRKLVTTFVATAALVVATAGGAAAAPAGPDFGAQARAAGLTAAQAKNLQQRVDAVLTGIPGGRQVSATEVRYNGMTATVDPHWSADAVSADGISCAYKYFCIRVAGTNFAFYTCQMWDLSNWEGFAYFNNNQTPRTEAQAWDSAWNRVFDSYAPEKGTVDVGPWYHFQPC